MKSLNQYPPQLAQRFLHWFLRDELAEEVEGDLEEKFYQNIEEHSLARARRNYWYQVFHYLRPFAVRNLSTFYNPTHYAMYRNYFKIGWRNILKHKGYSFINISGLAVGMMVAILIGLWVHNELSFNKYHENYDRIAWVMQNQTFEGEIKTGRNQALQLAPELRENYGTYFEYVVMSSFQQGRILRKDDKALTKTGIFMEATAPEMLTLRMLSGTRQGLVEPNTILLSESTAQAFFDDSDPIDEIIQIADWFTVKVTGVYEDFPQNSSFAGAEFIAPWELYESGLPEWLSWGNNWFQTMVQIAEHTEMSQASAAITDAKKKRVTEDEGARFNPELFLHPMSRVYLHSDFEQGVSVGGRIQYVWLFGIIGVFVLLLACINFMNLSTARSEKRAKEIGVRKAIGSLRSQLIHQFFTESMLIAALSFVVAILLVWLILPAFNEVADKEISILWSNPWFWLAGLGFVLLTGILAGSYPALYLSSLKAVRVLKGTFRTGRMAALPRKVLVVTQFAVSVSLIIGTLIVFQQIQFVKNRPIGYDIDRLFTVPARGEVNQRFNAFRNDLLQTGVVEEVAKSESPITRMGTTNSGLDWRGKVPGMQDEFVTMRISHEFGETVDWNIVEGRDFSRDFATDSMGFVINEAAVEYMGFDDPIGEQMDWGENGIYTIIGVVEDMITQSPYAPVRQMIFFIDYDRSDILNIKLKPDVSTQQALADIESVYKKFDPVNPFEYNFTDEQYAQKFSTEIRVGKLSGFFAILAIFISCLGLFGLASFVAERRTKEIGIRKVLGASVANLWQLLSKDFLGLILIACLLAIPLAYYFARDWLQNYEYRTDLNWWVFATAALGALLVTLLTVSYQTIKASTVNPVKSLRSE
ncbi:ABC transporter permease [Tunicatimonas pelagia]|uniref:ABC transporter permease n=1 Tax=Tunicatimonas pelagia TaxID=931531 RepID=UPI002665F40E|nr:ABC transporter permease [Tunicatimonas pelagia]WKN41406.1 ABC transporter permease [Tunicatimonas pelagia]